MKVTYSRLLCSLSAIGASGVAIVSHAFCTSTSRMALRETFFSEDFEPSVATSLSSNVSEATQYHSRDNAYQTVATPYLREVRTVRRVSGRV